MGDSRSCWEALSLLLSSRGRRSLGRLVGSSGNAWRQVVDAIGETGSVLYTTCRSFIILPRWGVSTFYCYSGREFKKRRYVVSMIGHYLGEYVPSRFVCSSLLEG